jgi:hypothetical protein
MTPPESEQLTSDIEYRAFRAAQKVGLYARKTRWSEEESDDRRSGFQLLDPETTNCAYGTRFDLSSAERIIEICDEVMLGGDPREIWLRDIRA